MTAGRLKQLEYANPDPLLEPFGVFRADDIRVKPNRDIKIFDIRIPRTRPEKSDTYVGWFQAHALTSIFLGGIKRIRDDFGKIT